MKIFLKQNWSEQFIYGDKTPSVFVGREQEIKSLKSIIKNNDSNAILISSVRGVGKTSFVHKALDEIKEVFPVFVNIGHTLSNEDIEKEKK
jgi:AAA+ ATPase superfamily predicted ATPase